MCGEGAGGCWVDSDRDDCAVSCYLYGSRINRFYWAVHCVLSDLDLG